MLIERAKCRSLPSVNRSSPVSDSFRVQRERSRSASPEDAYCNERWRQTPPHCATYQKTSSTMNFVASHHVFAHNVIIASALYDQKSLWHLPSRHYVRVDYCLRYHSTGQGIYALWIQSGAIKCATFRTIHCSTPNRWQPDQEWTPPSTPDPELLL